MKLSKRLLSIILVFLMAITSVTASSIIIANAASKSPVFTVNNVTGLTHNNAKISARITNPNKQNIKEVGFELGTASNKLTPKGFDKVNKAYIYVDASYLMSKYKVNLNANTTYYYRFYIIIGQKKYYSSVKSFKTLPDVPAISNKSISELTYNNATINGALTNPKNDTINKIGFQLGTSKDKLNTNKYYNFNKKCTSKALSFNMSSYKVTLKANTTYYYKMYVTSGNKTYYGSVQSFKTSPVVKYSPIKSLSISRIYQPKNDKSGCYLSSIATVYGYKVGTYSNVDYRVGGKDISQTSSALYKAFHKKNGGTWVLPDTISYYGLKKQKYDLTSVYNSLKAGKPVAIHAKVNEARQHASVVIGYKGNSNTLEESDFVVMEIKYDERCWKNSTNNYNKYANSPQKSTDWDSCYVTLDSWIKFVGTTPQNMVTY